jgi:hypothetical protein
MKKTLLIFTLIGCYLSNFGQSHYLGFSLGYGGADGTTPGYTYKISYSKKMTHKLGFKLAYLSYNSNNKLKSSLPEITLQKKYLRSDNTSQDPVITIVQSDVYNLSLDIKVNSTERSSISIVPGFYFVNQNAISNSGYRYEWPSPDVILTSSSYKDRSFSPGLELQYNYDFSNHFRFYTAVYSIFGSSSFGIQGGFEFGL